MPIRTLRQLKDTPRPPWVWEGFIAPKSFTLLSAYPKVGKTTMLWHFIAAMMNGAPFFDRETRRVPILYVSEEADYLLSERATALGYDDTWPIGFLTKEPGLTWEMVITYMKRWVYVHKEPLIIVDTLSRFWSAESENDATQVDRAISPVLELVRNSQASFFGIHHNRKQGGGGGTAVRGSTALTGGVDVIMEMSRTSSHDHSNVRRLQCESRFGETPSLLHMRLVGGQYIVEDAETAETEQAIIEILQSLEAVPLGDIVFLTGIPETTVRRALNGLVHRGVVSRGGSGTKRSPYVYSLAVLAD